MRNLKVAQPQDALDRPSKGEAARARILDVARDVLISDGLGAFVLRDVAARANMRLGNLQYYYPTREALLEATIRREAQSDLEAIRRWGASEKVGTAVLTSLVKHLIRKWRGESGKVFATMGFLALHQGSFRNLYEEIYRQYYEAIAIIIGRIFPENDKRRLLSRARLIAALLDGASLQLQRGSAPAFVDRVAALALRIAAVDEPTIDSDK